MASGGLPLSNLWTAEKAWRNLCHSSFDILSSFVIRASALLIPSTHWKQRGSDQDIIDPLTAGI
jgi:hypothetical protein